MHFPEEVLSVTLLSPADFLQRREEAADSVSSSPRPSRRGVIDLQRAGLGSRSAFPPVLFILIF